jgi:glycosyltransferase involved in cell wall biosynthesis
MGTGLYAERHAVSFLEELAAGVGDVTLCAPEIVVPAGTRLHGQDISDIPGVSAVTMKWRSGQRALFYGLSIFWLIRVVRRVEFLYVFLPGRLGVLAAFAATILRRPFGVYLRGSDIDLFGVRFCLSRATFVLATGPFLRDLAARHCNSSDIVSPMFDISASDLQRNRVQRETSTRWRLLYIGGLEEAKGTFDLLHAIEILTGRGVPVELSLVGSWRDEQAAREVEAAKREDSAVRFTGALNDRGRVKTCFLEADLFVFPSHSEGFPRVLYEAMTFGVPVVTTMVDGIPSVMRAGVNCLAAEVGDPMALADAIQLALENVSLRERIAAGGFSTMTEMFAERRPSHAEQVLERIRPIGGTVGVRRDAQ